MDKNNGGALLDNLWIMTVHVADKYGIQMVPDVWLLDLSGLMGQEGHKPSNSDRVQPGFLILSRTH